jgi:lipopolysaccharide export system protein LptC
MTMRLMRQARSPGERDPKGYAPTGQDSEGHVVGGHELKGLALPNAIDDVPPEVGRTGGYLAVVSRRGKRHLPTPGGLIRRRWMINASKFLLPSAAVLLLTSIALWPEFNEAADGARFVYNGLRAMNGARLTDAHYRGVDQRGRPYTVTAATATQRDEDQIDLTMPNGDMTMENGTWIDVKSKVGVYMRKAQQLDLSDDVVLYRDDGTTMTTSSATVDMRSGAASGSQATHVEGPFGTLDASGFTTVDKGAAIEFWGPIHAVLNGASQ